MKKILLSIAVILIAVSASAKRPTGLTLGGGFDVYTYANNNVESYEGIYAEVGYDKVFTKHSTLYVGGRFDWVVDGSYAYNAAVYKDVTNHHVFFDIPVKYRFNFNVSPKTKLYLEAGPTAVFWLGNSFRARKTNGSSSDIDRWSGFEGNQCNRANLALGGAFGVHFGHVKIYFGYDQCMFSMLKQQDGNPFVNNAQFRLGAAYIF